MGINSDPLILFYLDVNSLFDYVDSEVCPKKTLYCYKSKLTPSVIIGEPLGRYSIPQLKEMIRQRKITPKDAFLYNSTDSQVIAFVLYNLRKNGYILVSKKFLSGFPNRITEDDLLQLIKSRK